MNIMSEHEERIRARAQRLWEAAGRPTGRDEEFWLAAEAELKALATPKPKAKPPAKAKAAAKPKAAAKAKT
jgi:hypothetical protein